jgi:hypothetical protein
MSDTSAFIAGCATTGAAALMLLLARISLDESSARVAPDFPTTVNEAVMPVPVPPPPTTTGMDLPEQNDKVMEALADQKALALRLEAQLTQQDLLIRDLQTQIMQQQSEAKALTTRLDVYENSVSLLNTQQEQLAGVQRDTDKTQTSLLWVGAGLVLIVLVGGALVLVILVVLVAFQSRGRSSRPTAIVYPDMPPPPASYYQQEFLPASSPPRRVYQQDIYD